MKLLLHNMLDYWNHIKTVNSKDTAHKTMKLLNKTGAIRVGLATIRVPYKDKQIFIFC